MQYINNHRQKVPHTFWFMGASLCPEMKNYNLQLDVRDTIISCADCGCKPNQYIFFIETK